MLLTTVSIHEVASLTIEPTEHLTLVEDGHHYTSTKVTIMTETGGEHQLVLFGYQTLRG